MLYLFALIACDSSTVTVDGDTDAVVEETIDQVEEELPGEYEYTPDLEESAVFDPAAAAASLEAFFDVVYTLNSQPVFDAYFETIGWASGNCPSIYPGAGGDQFWITGVCETDEGARFSGYANYTVYENRQVFNNDETRYTGARIRGVSQVIEPDGSTLWMEGEVFSLVGTFDDNVVYYSSLEGWYSWDRPEVADIWLGDDRINPNLVLKATERGANRSLQLEGGVSGLSQGYESIYLDDVSLGTPSNQPGCSKEPTGDLWLRASNGEWFEIYFEGGAAESETCDGCGQVFQETENVGELCVDFSRLLDWGVSPW